MDVVTWTEKAGPHQTAEMIRRNPQFDDEQLKRVVLTRLELQRLTPAADVRLSTAIGIATEG